MKKIPLFGVVHTPEMEAVALEVLRSGRIASGDYVGKFEKGLGEIVGNPHVVSTHDMTNAVFLALYLAGVRAGDEVLTTAFSCMATNSAIAQLGATPVWVDVGPRSVEMDVDDAARKITARTKAVIMYHVAGYPGPARKMADLCKTRSIAFIEDCDNALCATQDGAHVGQYSDFSIYSFYPNRQINCTEGGALVCKSADMATKARQLRRFGIDGAGFRTPQGEINPLADIPEIGWAYTMNNLCAALGATQLAQVTEKVEKARANVRRLSARLADIDGIQPIPAADGALPAYWVMLCLAENRDALLQYLKDQDVSASILHHRNDTYSGFHAARMEPGSETTYLQDHIIALPCGWWLSDADVDAIGNACERATADAATSSRAGKV
ncbi:UDP-4-amino-4-deoxy-L-arabinose--oxoglutarate aminotransferase [Cupriavidus campinensis]|uniref:DegT/DnrJ/EryC1/StrS family aminotransferase n=1 Tax=Cupriavidus campinensis TaxID=151783 RepID=UPI001B0ED792|nr:DegT/DnrJ/EryC1/StrS family aminotransferase [Cupriavidus campinensis]CAG2142581.1 UDP-4-amino-4-deoxy-L-arabinose--oxoglutarate aminotransferase [Cupriavidus campinensis]